MKKIFYWGFLSAFFVLQSCNTPEQGNAVIRGNIEGIEEAGEIYLYKVTNKVVPFDTAEISSTGAFEMVSQIDHLGFFRLGFSQNQNYLSLVVGPDDEITVSGNYGGLEGKAQIEGSDETLVLQEYFASQSKFQNTVDSLRREMQYAQQNQNSINYRNALIHYRMFEQSNEQKIKAFLNENSDKVAALAALTHLNPEKDYELFDEVLTELEPKLKENPIYSKLKKQVDNLAQTQVGAQAPEITMTGVDGETIKLSSFKGKYVLIDFWASWCKPCRIENPNVVKMYNKYKNRDFEIFGVSLDEERRKWVEAIRQDGIEWVQVSDLNGWNNEAAQTYNVNSIPETVLVNPEGEIIARGLRGRDLEEKLEKLL